ncbi:Extracellular metalloproteinase 9 [Hypsizygus marmoreus]|uniref:Extracellular metalloproteinase n=1 Tax=Hypsizygus marmoreus TaxID=39966 RepID=A0A369K5R2_HYPMA|nr:Extracellular metalloproteinase 9 [Hypsizygus marmoreus]
MVVFNKFFASVFLAIVYASVSDAIIAPSYSRHSTRRSRNVGRGLQLDTFHPETKFETFGAGLQQPASLAPLSLKDATVSFVKSRLGVDATEVAFKNGYTTKSGKFAYVKQLHNDIPFANAVANVAWKDNKVVSFGASFVNTDNIASSTPSVTVESTIPKTEEALDGKYNGHPASLEYLARPDGSVSLTHVIQIQNEETGTWFEAFVDAHSGEIVSVTDFVSDATYKVLPITKETFPEGQEILVDPQDLLASPLGWHDDGTTKTNNTSGNNVIAFKGTQSALTVQSAPDLVFNYTYDDTLAPTDGQNVDAARTNAFYVINTVHDYAYRYGFTEAAFNFQANNFDKGGRGNDRVLMSVQDGSGTNNANFATPADGQSGTCRMFVWTRTPVRRDGDLENDIIVHEMTHGITNRMTGGGTGRCLQTTEAGGMGEGWSDAMAEWTEQKSANITDYVMGQYVINSAAGIRTHPYSTDPAVNPLRYSSIANLNEVHNIGEVWANLLHNVYAALVGKYGFSSTARTNPEGTEGNIVYLHLFIDALALQPCNPTFVSARDAWIQADANRYGGVNKCLLWTAFASRGLGVGAANFRDASAVPSDC